MNFLRSFFILIFILLLHPVKVALFRTEKFKEIYSIFALFDLLKLAIPWKDIKALYFLFGLRIQVLELHHSLIILRDPHYTLSSLGFDHLSVITHFPGFEFHKCLRLGLLHETLQTLKLVKIHFKFEFIILI